MKIDISKYNSVEEAKAYLDGYTDGLAYAKTIISADKPDWRGIVDSLLIGETATIIQRDWEEGKSVQSYTSNLKYRDKGNKVFTTKKTQRGNSVEVWVKRLK